MSKHTVVVEVDFYGEDASSDEQAREVVERAIRTFQYPGECPDFIYDVKTG